MLLPRDTVVLGLGTNLGDRRSTLEWALLQLQTHLREMRVSPLFETEPVSDIPQGRYLNLVVMGNTAVRPEELLTRAKELERRAGRVAGPKDSPRPLDIDLLLWGDQTFETSTLTLPHPRLRERRFVLAPLAALAPDLRIPPDGTAAVDLLEALENGAEVQPLAWPRTWRFSR